MEDGQEFEQFLAGELESAGDTADATPEPTPETTGTTESEDVPEDTADATPEDEEPLFDPELVKQNPQVAKQLQADYTRKMQALAEQRKQFEGVDPAALQWVRRFNEVAAYSPQAAAQMLQDELARLQAPSAPPPGQQAYDEDLLTDTERQIVQQNRTLQERLERIEQQQLLAQVQTQVNEQFAALEGEFGVKIPSEQRMAFLQEMARENIPHTAIGRMWKATHGWQLATRKAREEGARTTRAKQALPSAPSGLASREGSGSPVIPDDLGEFLRADLAGQL